MLLNTKLGDVEVEGCTAEMEESARTFIASLVANGKVATGPTLAPGQTHRIIEQNGIKILKIAATVRLIGST